MKLAEKNILLPAFLFLFQSAIGQTKPYDPDQMYAVDTLKADLQLVRQKLEKTHPGLYRYSAEFSMDAFFDSLGHTITHPMKEQEYLSILTLLNAKIRDGHTMFLPGSAASSYNNTLGRFFPFSVINIEGKLYITENYSNDSTIREGEEVLSINGQSTPDIMFQLLARQIRDGNNQTYPKWILDHYFAAYYSFTFGQPDQFYVEFLNTANERHKNRVTALTKDSIRIIRQVRYFDRHPQAVEGQGITLGEDKNTGTAILTIKSFDPDLLKSIYKQDYRYTMDSLFSLLHYHRTENLILDLRDNQGGDFPPARRLLSYLIIEPSRFLMDGKEARLIQPKVNHFSGRLFVLMNGGSFSATAIVIAILERDKRAIFIGEETGGNKHIICGDPGEEVLPRTKIRSYISSVTYRILAGVNDGHGVFPTYPVVPDITDILIRNDAPKTLALKLISGRHQAILTHE